MTKLTIATFNANSIRARLQQIIDWLDAGHADVLAIQETKVQDSDFPCGPIEEAGYHVVYAGQKRSAGVATISKVAPIEVTAGFDDGSDRVRLLCTRFEKLVLVNTYVPQGRDVEHEQFAYKLRWLEQIGNWFSTHFTPADPLVWVGDLNVATEDIDVHNPNGHRGHVDFHPDVQAALEGVRQWGFTDIFRKHHPGEPNQFTYFDYRARNPIERNIGWRIDHVWATPPIAERSTSAWIDVEARRAERPSDHTFLVATFDV